MWACAGADQVRLAAIVAAGLRQHRGAATAVLDGVNQVEVLQLRLFADHNPDVQADCSPADLDILSRVIVPFHAVS